MLVVHVPERRLQQDPLGIGDLEQHDCVVPVRPPCDVAEERGDVGDMLERVAADQGLRLQVEEALVEQSRDQLDCAAADADVDRWSDPDSSPAAHAAEEPQEGRVMARPDLDHMRPRQPEPSDPVGRQLVGEREEVLGDRLRLDVAIGVLDESVVVARVEEQPAIRRRT